MKYLDPLQEIPVDPLVPTVASALVSTSKYTQLFVTARAQLLKAHAPIFQTLRAQVTQTRSIDTTRRPNFLVVPHRVCGADACAFGVSRDIRGIFRHPDWVNRRLSRFPIPSIDRISGAIRRQTIQAVDGTFLSPSSVYSFRG